MHPTSDNIDRLDLDQKKLRALCGDGYDQEEFWGMRCPDCRKVYVVEYEYDSVLTDASDPKKSISSFDGFMCVACGYRLEKKKEALPWIGSRAAPAYRVSREDFAASEWAWALKEKV